MVTPFKYTPEIEKLMTEQYLANTPVEQIAEALEVPVRSVISKLSSLGVYKKKVYLTTRRDSSKEVRVHRTHRSCSGYGFRITRKSRKNQQITVDGN